jgi:hypothetical protein
MSGPPISGSFKEPPISGNFKDTTVQGFGVAQEVHIGTFVINNYSGPPPPAKPTDITKAIAPCPYPGLAYFGPDDAQQFFGRDKAIEKLSAAVTRQSLTALVGASGSGKSSVVLAGLAPRLHRDGSWLFSYFRLGHDRDHNPFLELARALVPFYVQSETPTDRLVNTRKLAQSLCSGELTLGDVFADCRSQNKGRRILLIADQFEEAFTLVTNDDVRNHFIDVLLSGFVDPLAGERPDICLILTLRGDFYGHALQYRPLSDVLQTHVENLGPMIQQELTDAIVEPARRAGATFESGLVQTLLDDVEHRPGSLPLLQFALREMWGRQRAGEITHDSYHGIGRIEGALATRAEAIFTRLTEFDVETQIAAKPEIDRDFRLLFTRLVTLGEGQEGTRRVVERRELSDTAWSLAQRLADEENRLVVTNDPTDRVADKIEESEGRVLRETVEVVHEALIRRWPRLVGWLDRDRALQSWLAQIRPNIGAWSRDRCDEAPLLRGGMLVQGTRWLAERRDDLNPEEQAYVEASIELRKREEEEKQVAARAELRWAQEEEERRKLQQSALQERERQARWEAYSPYAARIGQQFGMHANLLMERWTTQPGATPTTTTLVRHTAEITGVAFPPKGKRLATASRDKSVRFWGSESGHPFGVPLQHSTEVTLMAFSPDGERLTSVSPDISVYLWDVERGELIRAPMVLAPSFAVALSLDGKRLVSSSSSDFSMQLWDTESGQSVGERLWGHKALVLHAAFSPTGDLLATADAENVHLWDAQSGRPVGASLRVQVGWIRSLLYPVRINSVALSPDSKRLATACGDHLVRLWDLDSGHPICTLLQGHSASVFVAAFSPDGKLLASASSDGTVRLWDAKSGEPIGLPLWCQQGGRRGSLAFSPDGKRLASASRDSRYPRATHEVWLWDISDRL